MKGVPETLRERKIPKPSPEEIILAIRDEVFLMGFNDIEKSQFENILEKLRLGKLTPDKAVAEAKKIELSKQDYH